MKNTLGRVIARARKDKGMTQLELAQKLGVTDKAVSKWERELSCPDIGTLPVLARELDLSLEELLQGREAEAKGEGKEAQALVSTILKAVALATGVAVAALSALGALEPAEGLPLMGLGLACLALWAMRKEE